MRLSRKVTDKVASVTITSAAYGLIAATTVKGSLTKDNIGKALSLTGKAAVTTARTIRSKAGNLRSAVHKRKVEILAAKSEEDTLL